jgi:hypothetical protein
MDYFAQMVPRSAYDDEFMHHGLESRFGLGLLPSDLHSEMVVPRLSNHHLPTGYRRPWQIARAAFRDMADKKSLHFGKDGFQACVDVHHFEPSEITVKTVDNVIVIQGKHQERTDGHGTVERSFVRKYTLPAEYDQNTVRSTLSSDGVLTVTAAPPHSIKAGERAVPIMHSNVPAHLNLKPNTPDGEKNGHKNGGMAVSERKFGPK